MEINNLDKLAKVVTENLLGKLELKPSSSNSTVATSNKLSKSCLILIPHSTLGFKDYYEFILKHYKDYKLYLSSSEEFSKLHHLDDNGYIHCITSDLKSKEFMLTLESVETILLIGAKVSQMKAIVETDDSEEVNHILLNALMTNKKIIFVLNSNPVVFNKISTIVTSIQNMGITVTNIQDTPYSKIDKTELITENYVIGLKQKGIKTLELDRRQVVTPLAKDKLSEYKIKVVFIEEAKK